MILRLQEEGYSFYYACTLWFENNSKSNNVLKIIAASIQNYCFIVTISPY